MSSSHPIDQNPRSDAASALRRALIYASVAVVVIGLWHIRSALLLIFGGLIFAVMLNGMSRSLQRLVPVPYGGALAVSCLLLIAGAIAFVSMLGPRIGAEFRELVEWLPAAVNQVIIELERYPWGSGLIDRTAPTISNTGEGLSLISRALGAAWTIADALANLFLILFIGLFFAINPAGYKAGIQSLVPKRQTRRAGEVLDTVGETLWRWLKGQFVAMLFVGVATTIGLMLIDMPLALVLGFVAGIFDFIPTVGPIIGAIPGILLALTQGPEQALMATLVYFVVQQVETYVVVPIVQKQQVRLPPALLLISILVFGLLFGVLGVILSAPLAVAVMVLVRMLYVEDILGKKPDEPPERSDSSVPLPS
jgi:predicted PurR-regulated permease PerM